MRYTCGYAVVERLQGRNGPGIWAPDRTPAEFVALQSNWRDYEPK